MFRLSPVASALGTPGVAAYLALTRRAQLQKGENVLILGASGVVGVIAIQLARLLGAGRVIAGARNEEGLERARRLGADATVDLKQIEGLPERIREASGGQLQVVLDPVWGTPGAVALEALSRYGRSVHMGQAAGPEATLKSNTLRGGFLSILGYSTFLVPWEEQEAAYRALLDHAAAGQIEVDYEILPLEAAPEAWRRQAGSPHRRTRAAPSPSTFRTASRNSCRRGTSTSARPDNPVWCWCAGDGAGLAGRRQPFARRPEGIPDRRSACPRYP